MKLINIDSEAYKTLAGKIERIYKYIVEQTEKQAAPPDASTVWIDNTEAAELLEISTRTLQRLRSGGEVTYSIWGGRVRYRLSDIQQLIAGRIFPSKYRREEELIAAHQAYYERGKADKGKKSDNRK